MNRLYPRPSPSIGSPQEQRRIALQPFLERQTPLGRPFRMDEAVVFAAVDSVPCTYAHIRYQMQLRGLAPIHRFLQRTLDRLCGLGYDAPVRFDGQWQVAPTARLLHRQIRAVLKWTAGESLISLFKA